MRSATALPESDNLPSAEPPFQADVVGAVPGLRHGVTLLPEQVVAAQQESASEPQEEPEEVLSDGPDEEPAPIEPRGGERSGGERIRWTSEERPVGVTIGRRHCAPLKDRGRNVFKNVMECLCEWSIKTHLLVSLSLSPLLSLSSLFVFVFSFSSFSSSSYAVPPCRLAFLPRPPPPSLPCLHIPTAHRPPPLPHTHTPHHTTLCPFLAHNDKSNSNSTQ